MTKDYWTFKHKIEEKSEEGAREAEQREQREQRVAWRPITTEATG